MNTELFRTIFLATLPILITIVSLLGVIIWNLIEVKSIRKDLWDLAKRISDLAERVSKIEGKIEGKHLVIE